MARIRQCRGRHFIDENGRLYWINGPEEHCYLSEQRQWRAGLSFEEVLDWKQCAPSGLVSQRFASVQEAREAFEHGLVHWSSDLYLRRMGERMQAHRSPDDYKPTAMMQAEAQGAPVRRQPWLLPEASGPVCGLRPRQPEPALCASPSEEVVHATRRRRGCSAGTASMSSPSSPAR
ncbi:MAG: hypothetical protein VKL23_01440 [Cyanobacteriota bacterium]|nr:hypothetical protein [Cyanobacteriota bacterium]